MKTVYLVLDDFGKYFTATEAARRVDATKRAGVEAYAVNAKEEAMSLSTSIESIDKRVNYCVLCFCGSEDHLCVVSALAAKVCSGDV